MLQGLKATKCVVPSVLRMHKILILISRHASKHSSHHIWTTEVLRLPGEQQFLRKIAPDSVRKDQLWDFSERSTCLQHHLWSHKAVRSELKKRTLNKQALRLQSRAISKLFVDLSADVNRQTVCCNIRDEKIKKTMEFMYIHKHKPFKFFREHAEWELVWSKIFLIRNSLSLTNSTDENLNGMMVRDREK